MAYGTAAVDTINTSGNLTVTGNVIVSGNSDLFVSGSQVEPLVLGTAQASTSGTSIDFTSIPSWVKRVTINFASVSTNGTSPIVVRLGTSGGIVSTGYLGASQSSGATVATQNWTTGFGTRATTNAAADVYSGIWLITLLDLATNTWCSSHVMGLSNQAVMCYGGGSVALPGTLDRVRITTSNGTDAFDAGSVNILYE